MIQGLPGQGSAQGNHKEEYIDAELLVELLPLLGLQVRDCGGEGVGVSCCTRSRVLGWGHTASPKLRGCELTAFSDLTLLSSSSFGDTALGKPREQRASSMCPGGGEEIQPGAVSTVSMTKGPF